MHPKYWKPRVLREEASDGTTGSTGGGALDMASAAAAFPMSDAPAEESKPTEQAAVETPEAAAEQIAQDEARAEAEKAGEKSGEPTEGDDSDPLVTIKVKGKPVTLKESEWAERHEAELRQADYTRKTMEAADARKTAEAETQKARGERDAYAQKLQHFAIQANGELTTLAATLTEQLLDSDPVEYLRQQRTFNERQAQLQQAQQELQQIGTQQQQEHEQAVKTYQGEQLEKLHAKLPDWKDPAKAKVEAAAIKDYLGSQEFGAEDIAQMSDHRMVILARKAMQFDALQAKARDAVKKVQAAPAKVERPGNGVAPTDGRTRAMKNLDSSGGSLSAAANVFAQFL